MSAEVTITLDGKEVSAPAGTNLIDLAKSQGIEIPHYCYHQALPVAGNCRVCFVEVEGMPHPQIACNTPLRQGMVVHTRSQKAVKARQWTLEFLLANHPLDCPICDKAGECDLQNYSFKYGKTHTDFNEKKRTPATIQLSPRLWIEKDRCIVCARCVQFLRHVSGKEELYIKQRGNASEICTAPGKEVESPYQLNTVDICPVGALSATNFRYAERVWNLTKHESICPLCPRGCATTVETKENHVHRVTPRYNPAVNSHWMCDEGRTFYQLYHHGKPRLQQFHQASQPADRQSVLLAVKQLMQENASKQVIVWLSNWLCNEDIQAIHTFATKQFRHVTFTGPQYIAGGDHLLRQTDIGPNAKGLRSILGSAFIEVAQLSKSYDLALSFLQAPSQISSKQTALIYYGAFADNANTIADWAIPGLAHGEIPGSYTNINGLQQKFSAFLLPPPQALSVDEFIATLSTEVVS